MQSPQLIFGDINSYQNLVEFLHVKFIWGEGITTSKMQFKSKRAISQSAVIISSPVHSDKVSRNTIHHNCSQSNMNFNNYFFLHHILTFFG